MLTVEDMLENVCDDLRKLFTGYTLPNKSGVLQEVRIFPQYIPQPSGITVEDKKTGVGNYSEEDYEANFPGIVVKLGDVVDQEERRLDMNRASVRLLFGVYDASPSGEGWRDVLAMMEKVRGHWLRERIIARKFRIEMPLTTRLLESDTFPIYFGEMNAVIECGRPGMRNADYVYRGYISNG